MNVLPGCLCLCFILQGCSAGIREWPAEEDDRLIDNAATSQTQAMNQARAMNQVRADALWDRFLDWAKMA